MIVSYPNKVTEPPFLFSWHFDFVERDGGQVTLALCHPVLKHKVGSFPEASHLRSGHLISHVKIIKTSLFLEGLQENEVTQHVDVLVGCAVLKFDAKVAKVQLFSLR